MSKRPVLAPPPPPFSGVSDEQLREACRRASPDDRTDWPCWTRDMMIALLRNRGITALPPPAPFAAVGSTVWP